MSRSGTRRRCARADGAGSRRRTRCRRRTARCAASRGGPTAGRRFGADRLGDRVDGSVGWFWSCVIGLLLLRGRVVMDTVYPHSTDTLYPCQARISKRTSADTVCPCPPPPAGARPEAARPSDRSSTRRARSSPPRTSMRVSMRRVAAKANVSLSTVVRHFGTKDALLAALVSQGGDDEERDELRTKHGARRRRRRGSRRRRRLRGGRPAADAHAGPGAPLSCAVGAARPRPTRPPQVGAGGRSRPSSLVEAAPERPSSRTCWSSPRTSTRGSSSASTVGSAPERPVRR